MSATTPFPDALVPLDEFAASVHKSPRTVRRYADEGRITAYRFGDRGLFFDPNDRELLISRVPVPADR
jgi:hypothetical protein